MRRLLLAVVLCLTANPLFAWGEKGHYLVAEAATMNLPSDMPPFFYKAFPELIWLAYDPDRLRNAGESIDAVNPPDHFMDYEYAADLQLPPDRYKYIALLESTGTLRRHGIDAPTIGFLPWRIAEMSEYLQNLWKQWRASRAGSPERLFIEHEIIHVAGVLGHFAGDSAQPLHATTNFNGWVDPNPNGYANDCEIHSRFETSFVARAITAGDVTPKVAPLRARSDYFASAIEMIRSSNALAEQLYRIDRDGGFNVFRTPSTEAKEFTAQRIAAGGALLRDLWWSAWKSSEKPVKKKATED
jgi:hypothetical protein